jgi:hypothetical protein
MALDGSYNGLKASIADFLNRADLTAAIPDFIRLAEAQMTRRFAGRQRQGLPIPRRLIQRADADVDQGMEYVAVPSDFHGPIDFVLQGSPEIVLDYLDATNLQQQKQRDRVKGAPRWYAVVGGSFQLYPIADQAYTAELTYIARAPALSDTSSSNWILTSYPDAYLYGALVQSAPYLKDDARATTWGTLFTTALDDICDADPMPSDKLTLRTEFPQIQRMGFRYDIDTDGR